MPFNPTEKGKFIFIKTLFYDMNLPGRQHSFLPVVIKILSYDIINWALGHNSSSTSTIVFYGFLCKYVCMGVQFHSNVYWIKTFELWRPFLTYHIP